MSNYKQQLPKTSATQLLEFFGFRKLNVGFYFGLQNLTSNFISGIMLFFERHVQIGDRVTVAGTTKEILRKLISAQRPCGP